ncbi:hypothetical protein K470DRAFT_270020 [Piedraia hortae CBS 480.64]|uniref:SLA1 homology domain-containing protein n=1 Tax=Piedraia hortae CBS 480.64 TaxID=1314780 RepID=A0A6A7C1N2_9PEZI|nr:hypothetical protein K470DRAFT_270020 [Piedraia hortae CBS 480.64]
MTKSQQRFYFSPVADESTTSLDTNTTAVDPSQPTIRTVPPPRRVSVAAADQAGDYTSIPLSSGLPVQITDDAQSSTDNDSDGERSEPGKSLPKLPPKTAPEYPPRPWHDLSNTFSLHASLQSVTRDGSLLLSVTNQTPQKTITVSPSKLCSADIAYVEEVTGKTLPPASKVRDLPRPEKVRKWTDASGMYSADAEFGGWLKDRQGVVLHKFNGVRIGVPLERLGKGGKEVVENLGEGVVDG